MPSLEKLAAHGVRFARQQDAAVHGDRAVIGVWPVSQHTTPTDVTLRGRILVADGIPDWLTGPSAASALRRLASIGVAALAVSGEPVPQALAELGDHHRVPLLELSPDTSAQQLTQEVSDLRIGEETAVRQRIQQLHARTRDMVSGQGQAVMLWLQQALAPGKANLLGPRDDITDIDVPADTVAALRSGRQDTAADHSGPRSVRMYALGQDLPRHVLVVTVPGPAISPAAAQAVTLALPLLNVDLELRRAREIRRCNEQTRLRAGTLLLNLLLSGDIAGARRTARPLGLSADLMSAETARFLVVRCATRDRDAFAEECGSRLPDGQLVIRNPDTRDEVVIIARDDAERTIVPALRDLVAEAPDRYLGVSAAAVLQQIPAARDEAYRALAAAVRSGSPVGDYGRGPELTSILLSAPAQAWASRFLSPLDSAFAAPARRAMLDTAALWIRYGANAAAEATGTTPNTTRVRVRRIEEALGLDLAQLGHRVLLDLAHRIDLLPAPVAAPDPCTLQDLFSSPPARRWAQGFLAAVPNDPRRIRRTLTTWLAAGGRSADAATLLGMHRKSVNSHLVAVETALQIRLLAHPSLPKPSTHALTADYAGPTDVALAALALGELSYEQLRPPAGHHEAPVRSDTANNADAFDASSIARQLCDTTMALASRAGSGRGLGRGHPLGPVAARRVTYVTVNLARELLTGHGVPIPPEGTAGLRRAAVASTSARPWPRNFLAVGSDLPLLPDQATASTCLFPDAETIAASFGYDPALQRALVPDEAVTTLVRSPLTAAGQIFGFIEVWTTGSVQPFVVDDLRLLSELASRAALRIARIDTPVQQHELHPAGAAAKNAGTRSVA